MYPTIIIPSMNPVLCAKARAFIPKEWPVIVKDGNPSVHFDEIKLLDIRTKWAINVDEDCFIMDPPAVLRLIETMEAGGYDSAGIQDGSSYIRHHNPVLFNPFFFVFNVAKVQAAPKLSLDIEETRKYAHLVRFHHLPHKYDGFEPYYSFMLDLLEAGLKPLFLASHAYEAFDPGEHGLGKPSILLGEDGKELAIHAWYSRLWHLPAVQDRIRQCEEYALANPHSLKPVKPAAAAPSFLSGEI